MKRNYAAVVIAIVGVISALLLVNTIMSPIPENPPTVMPASNPYPKAISATGIIEGVKDNVDVGTPVPGVVEKEYVEVWQDVSKGDPLFLIDSREIQAQLRVDRAEAKVARAKVIRIQDQLERLMSVEDKRAVSADDIRTKENDVSVAENEYNRISEEVAKNEIMLERLTVRAPMDGTVIQKNVRVGEYLPLDPKEPAIIIGDMRQLQIRADVDEQNAPGVKRDSPAVAFPKNRPDLEIPLAFEKIEPYVIPKKSLTGLSDERVDTRVLQVIYTFEPPQNYTLYIGQQVDVFIGSPEGEE